MPLRLLGLGHGAASEDKKPNQPASEIKAGQSGHLESQPGEPEGFCEVGS